MEKGTAVATFVDGKYPNESHGNHAALYISQDGSGVWVMDQWSTKPSISKRKMLFKGKNSDGTYKDPSNNGDALSVIIHE
ncbi:BPSL0067 family protein [Methylocaldum marinum]|uniref:BPSL0067 family protein n=1 Tax=Methylocaldum marinum TaxID=1432792 RepID=UPI000E68AD31